MILGIGTDLIEHVRVQREIEKNPWADGDGIFTPQEIARCGGSARAVAGYAACFAAKEAALKALGLEVRDLGMFREVELCPNREGAYAVLLHGRVKEKSENMGVRHISLSIAANTKLTGAMVVLES